MTRPATTEPQLERIATWNAESNEHMIAVNEAMGYTVFGPPNTWFRLDVAAVYPARLAKAPGPGTAG